MNDNASEFRRRPRRRVPDTVAVVDCMTGRAVGRLGNLSETGMLLMSGTPLVDDAIYQLRFELDGTGGTALPIEVGAHLLWQDEANAAGQRLGGLRFINLPESQRQALRDWLDQPGASYA